MDINTQRIGQSALFCIVLFFVARIAPAQTRFTEPPDAEDFSRYTTAEQCVAATKRLAFSIMKEGTVNWDTMPPGSSWRTTPWPESVVGATNRCAGQKGVTTVPLEDFRWLFELYLTVAREDHALALLNKRLAEVTQVDTARATALIFAANAMLDARPVRLRQADSLWKQLEQFSPDVVSGTIKVDALYRLRTIASELGDTAHAMQLALRVQKSLQNLTAEEKTGMWANWSGRFIGAENLSFIHFRERLDSLRAGTAAYLRLIETQDKALSTAAGFLINNKSVGRNVPALRAQFWFPQQPAHPRPTAGQISLMYPLDEACSQGNTRSNMFGRCQGMFAMLRRISQQFPEVEITLLTHTVGYFLDQAPPSPAQEAGLMRDWLLGYQRLPATLAVEEMPYVTLKDPDRRTVNTYEGLSMSEFLGYDYTEGQGLGSTYHVVDETGTVVWVAGQTPWGELQLVDVLRTLLKRQR